MRLLPIKAAIKIPILCRYNVKCISLKGNVLFSSTIKPKMVLIGFGNVGVFDKSYERTLLEIDGDLVINDNAFFGHGSRISIAKGACFQVGSNFINTAEMTLVCCKSIIFGHNVLVSWNTLIMDSDMHRMINTDTRIVYAEANQILIGNNVWLCARSVVLKGSNIPDGCIVGANSLVSRSFSTKNTLIAGNPAVEKKYNITRLDENGENINSNDLV